MGVEIDEWIVPASMMDGGTEESRDICIDGLMNGCTNSGWVDAWTDRWMEFSKVMLLEGLLSLSGSEVRGSLREARKLRLPEYCMAWSHAVHLRGLGSRPGT